MGLDLKTLAATKSYVKETLNNIESLKGEKGDKGDPGKDGFSPTITTTSINGGHEVTITDINGVHNFNIMDGNTGNIEQKEQSDWDVNDINSSAYIKNKPKIPIPVRVKGDTETEYHTGDYNITPAAIGALKVSTASMEKHPIRDVTHIQNGRLDLDMGWGENHGTEANLSLGIRAVNADSADFKSVVTISEDSVEMKATGDNGICRMGIHWDGLLLSGSNGGHYAFPCGPGLCEIAPKDRIDITTPDEIGIVAGDHVAINAGGKVRITAQDKIHITSGTEIRLIPGVQDSNAAPDPSKYVKTGNIQGIKNANGKKPSISNFGDIRSETYNGHKVLGINGGMMESGAMISFTDSYPNGNNTVNLDTTGLEVEFKEISLYGFRKSNIQSSGIMAQVEYSTGKQDLITLVGEGIEFNGGNNYACSIDVNDPNNLHGGLDIYANDLSPKEDTMSLGNMCNWDVVHANTGTIQTSDRNKKNSIAELSEQKANDFIMGLKPSIYKMNNGTSGRTHWGLISQDIENLMHSLDMDSKDFAGFIKSPKIIMRDTDENGNALENPVKEVVDGEYNYSLRYDEFIAPMIKVIQRQQIEIESLKQDNANIHAKLIEIENRLGVSS